MSDDVAIRWSTYEQDRRYIRDEHRHEILRALDSHLAEYKNRALNNHFLAGFELAMDLVRNPREVGATKTDELNVPTLF